MPATDNAHCAACHGDARQVKTAFAAFANHPAFQPSADLNTLRFNHQRHEAADIPLLAGHKLDCADCHQPDATGRYLRPITFAANCRACHGLQFDPELPDLHLPHGDPEAVRSFLRTLPVQYASYATRVKRLPVSEVNDWTAAQMTRIRDRYRSGENLEHQAFFNTAVATPDRRPLFPGCAYCHEVKAIGEVTNPAIPDRWLAYGEFNHAKHARLACRECHAVNHSRATADVLLPGIETCRQCHTPQVAGKETSGVRSECITCHAYHAPLAKLGVR